MTPTDTPAHPAGRIRGHQAAAHHAALIMSVFLMTSSFVTTLLIPPEEFQPGGRGQRPGAGLPGPRVPRQRVRHVYDASTIVILWFAGASAMAGLLNLDPALPAPLRHGPGVGPAPSGRWC